MKMAAAAGNGDEQDRIEGSTAHDPADGTDSFFFRVTNFSNPFAHADEHRTSKLRRGYGRRPKALSITTARTTMGATVIRTSCSEGDVCGSASMCENPMLVIPAGRAVSAEGGMAVHQGDDT